MCNFLSAVLMKNGDLIWDIATDSHSDLVSMAGLKDTELLHRPFVRVEYAPPDKRDRANIDKYTLRVDERGTLPDWCDESLQEKAAAKMRAIVSQCIVTDERAILVGGVWVLGDGAYIGRAVNARIISMHGSSHVGALCDSSRVEELLDSSHVEELRDSSHVGGLYGSSHVEALYGSSHVGELYDSSRVGSLYGSSHVGALRDSSHVGALRDSSRIINDCRTGGAQPKDYRS